MSRDPLRGSLFENLVIVEALKYRYNRGERSNLHYYRDARGHEVDLLIETGGRLFPVEIKSGATMVKEFFSSIDKLARTPGITPCSDGAVVYGGTDNFPFKNHSVIAYNSIHRMMAKSSPGLPE